MKTFKRKRQPADLSAAATTGVQAVEAAKQQNISDSCEQTRVNSRKDLASCHLSLAKQGQCSNSHPASLQETAGHGMGRHSAPMAASSAIGGKQELEDTLLAPTTASPHPGATNRGLSNLPTTKLSNKPQAPRAGAARITTTSSSTDSYVTSGSNTSSDFQPSKEVSDSEVSMHKDASQHRTSNHLRRGKSGSKQVSKAATVKLADKQPRPVLDTQDHLKTTATSGELPADAEPSKRPRSAKTAVQVAELQMSNRALQSLTNADSLIVEMPASFCADGDAGSIGRFALSSAEGVPQMTMDIKGRHEGVANIELVSQNYIQAVGQQAETDVTAKVYDWSDDEALMEKEAKAFLKQKALPTKAKRQPKKKR